MTKPGNSTFGWSKLGSRITFASDSTQNRAHPRGARHSGWRVGEARSLQWRDVVPFVDDHGRSNVQLHVRGKRGEHAVIPRVAAAPYIKRVRDRSPLAQPDELVFRMSNGGAVFTLIDQLNVMLTLPWVVRDSAGHKFTLYSLRPFYAVPAIVKDIDIYTLARHMGTSVNVIEDYYGRHATPVQRAAKLGGRVRRT